jgi:Asp-tRNA(Asn)/Glu-tRNA(Gln) amidotransferase A subunit family amidase
VTRDAWATAAAIRDGSLRAVEAVQRSLDRIAEVDDAINAFTVVTADAALERAHAVDAGVVR